ncbi:MAG: flagellar hook-length control protein FliK [Clostridiales Family XIII bacterium]|jgi:flagellar hook-length control protein FliK|nr:flagellar hook-length control protein FliK [Clostridiales Family XIII bacterium]
MTNVNLMGGAQGAQGAEAASAANAASAADAALFQNLIAAALLQRGGTGAQATAALAQGTAAEADAEGAAGLDLSLLVKLLLGGDALARAPATDGAETVPARDALLSAIAEAPAEELLAASTGSLTAEALALLADDDAASGTGTAHAALLADGTAVTAAIRAATAIPAAAALSADGAANGAAVEAAIRAAAAIPVADGPAGGAPEAEAPMAAKAVRLDAPLPADTTPRASRDAKIADAEALSLARAEDGAATAALAAEAPADGATTPRILLSASSGTPESGAAAEARGASGAAIPQDGIAAAGTESAARTADPGSGAEKTAPYGQIAREVFTALADKRLPTTLSMRLEPAELGRIDVSMKLTSAGKLVIDIAAESAKTQALLAGQTDKLVQALGLQNVQVESVNTGAAFQGQQPAYAYGDRSMAFFMDLAQGGGREEESERDGKARAAQSGGSDADVAAEEAAPAAPHYARRLDLTA